MNNLKWADVAHMYINSGIRSKEGHMLVECRDGQNLWQYQDEGVQDFPFDLPSGDLPILRHLEDMTEDEARDFDFYRSGYPWKEDDGSCAAFVKYQYRVYRDGVIKSYGSPIALHWLYKNGFDLHRLIESGEAIRKPKA